MRFIYGFILGLLTSTIGAILYLAFAGGEYLVQLSPHYHELVSEVTALRDAKQQRDQLATRLDTLAASFDGLSRRFADLRGSREEAHPSETVELPRPAEAPASPKIEAVPSETPSS
jgi:hypothetical protein